MSLDVPLNPVFLLSFNMRYTDIDSRNDTRTSDGAELVTNTSDDTFEPRVELLWDNPYYSWNNGFKIRKKDTDSDVTGVTRIEENYFSRFEVEEGLLVPRLTFQYGWFRNSDNLLVTKLDSNENRVSADAEKNLGPFRFLYNFDGDRFDNDINRLVEDRIDHEATITYNQNFWRNRISLFGDVRGRANRTIAKRPPLINITGAAIELVRVTDQGFYSDGPDDANPLDDPLTVGYTDLIDGDTGTPADPPGASTEVNLNMELQNLGVRLQTTQSVDTIFLYIVDEDSIGPDETDLDGITWRVFFSNTASNVWTEVSGVSADFNLDESRFEISFPSTAGRFFRIRNENKTQEGILVTEMDAVSTDVSEEELKLKRRDVTESFDEDVTARVTFRPFRFISFNYDFFFSQLHVEPEGAQDLDRVHTGTISFTPHPILGVSARAQRSYSDLAGRDTLPRIEDLYTAAVTSTPLPTLTHSVTFTRREERERPTVLEMEVDTGRDDTAIYDITAEVYRNFVLGLEVTWARSWDLANREPSTITSQGLLRLDATLRPDLRISGDYTGGQVREGVLRSERRISEGQILVSYRPTTRISTQALYDFQDEAENKGLEQTYQINWIAFTGGTLDLTANFSLTKDTRSNELQQRGGFAFFWRPRRWIQVELKYSVQRDDEEDSRSERQTVSGTVSLRR